MRFPILALPVLAFSAVTLTARADTIDDFKLSNGTHTITYSLPATSSSEDFALFTNITEIAPATIDGVSGYSLTGTYVVFPSFPFTLELNVPTSIFGSPLQLGGPPILTSVTVPANNPAPYLPYDIVTTFTPGTYNLLLQNPNAFYPSSPNYTLTITPEAAATPEPSTLVLLATGTFTLLARRKLFRR